MTLELSPRRVVVSGGGTGIGRAIAARFALDGDSVVILGRRENVLTDAAKLVNADLPEDRVTTLAVDLEDPAAVERAAATIAAAGDVDVLVNNAGGIAARRRLAGRHRPALARRLPQQRADHGAAHAGPAAPASAVPVVASSR